MAKKSSSSFSLDDMQGLIPLDTISDQEDNSSEVVDTMGFANRRKIESPLEVFNCMLGGGIPFGSVVELAGPSTSGKSTYAYQELANCLRDYPNARGVIIESEASLDSKRARNAMGIDTKRVVVFPGATIESGFNMIIDIAKGYHESGIKDPIFFLWDSLSNSATEAQVDRQDPNGGGMAEQARLIKSFLKILFTHFAHIDARLVLISQVSQKIGGYVGGYNTSGGEGLKHDVHLKIWFDQGKTEYNDLGIASETYSECSFKKSKMSPLIKDIPVVVSNKLGGRIDGFESFWNWFWNKGAIEIYPSGWYSLSESFKSMYPQFMGYIMRTNPKLFSKQRFNVIHDAFKDDECLQLLMKLFCMDRVSNDYVLQRDVIKPYKDKISKELEKYAEEVSNYAGVVTDEVSDISSDEE